MPPERKLAGFFTQIKIICWKNLLLYIQNKSGIIAEIVVATLFILLAVLLISISKIYPNTDDNEEYKLVDIGAYELATGKIFYYPESELTTSLAWTVASFLNRSSESTNISDAYEFNKTQLDTASMLISFPDAIRNVTEWPDAINYTVYIKNTLYGSFETSRDIFMFNKKDIFANSAQSFCQNNRGYKIKLDKIKYIIDLALISSQQYILHNWIPEMDKFIASSYRCPEYYDDLFKTYFSFLIPMIISISFLPSFIINISAIITEKESKMKEYLRLIGVKPSVMGLCSIMRLLFVYFVLSTLFAILLKGINMTYIDDTSRPFLSNTSTFVLIIVLMVYSIQTTVLSLLVGQIFHKTLPAKAVTIFVWLFTITNYADFLPGPPVFYLLTFFPNLGLNFCFQASFQYERADIPGRIEKNDLLFGKIFANFYATNELDKSFADANIIIGLVLLSMIAWTWFYVLLSWYIERIFPGEYGVKLPLYFPFMKSYWFKQNVHVIENPLNNEQEDTESFEKVPKTFKASVRLNNLTKKFYTGLESNTVVKNLSLNFYENQITGFLGHNGAGKTTVTFMLCGLYSPSSGTAYILDQDIRNEMDDIRTSLGFCPQHSIVFDELTVNQHLDLVASIKGFSKNDLKKEILRIASCVGLANDGNKKSKELSGGMKRRLSIAMALIGDAKVIILDEPTSGLDPYNRRAIWEVLKKYKQDRTIILTTHYMEEADALSDRIALMNHGEVKCCGSPIYLKNKFGSGYRITLTKEANFKQDAFDELVTSTIGEQPKVLSNMAKEMCFGIDNNYNSKLPELLNKIEESKNQIGILNYGISSATIEEVFLKLGSIDVNEDKTVEHEMLNAFSGERTRPTKPAQLILQQIISLLLKRFNILRRRYLLTFFTLFSPIIINILLGFISGQNTIDFLSNLLDSNKRIEPFSTDLSQYGPQKFPYMIHGLNDSAEDPWTAFKNFTSFFEKYISEKSNGIVKPELIKDNNFNLIQFVYEKQSVNYMDLTRNYYGGVEFNFYPDSYPGRTMFNAKVMHNRMVRFSEESSLNEINSFILAYASKNSNKTISSNINTINREYMSNNSDSGTLELLNCAEIIPFTVVDSLNGVLIAFLISLNTIALTRERKSGSKSLQLLHGTHFTVYWLSNYIFDFLLYFFNIMCMLVTMKLVSLTDHTGELYMILGVKPENFWYLLTFLVSASFSWSTFAYVWSFKFKSDILGFVVLFLVQCGAIFVDMIMVVVITIFGYDTNNFWVKMAKFFRTLFSLTFPSIGLKRALFNLKIQNIPECIANLKVLKQINVFDFYEPGIGQFLAFNWILCLVGLVFIFILENKPLVSFLYEKCFSNGYLEISDQSEESDVIAEAIRVNNGYLSDPIVVKNLTKIYKKKLRKVNAVKKLSFSVKQKECFGLLGLNGAGKTTTLKIMTTELRASEGSVLVNGVDLTKELWKKDIDLGFCPQFDYLPDFLTVKEILCLFANLRGIPSSQIQGIVADFIEIFKLTEFSNKFSQNLSGGNKRKVSSAIAFIGKPKTVILDEPTSGMDPAARRYLWNVIKRARDQGTTIILTTHSMEEAEALCTRLAIMVNGKFDCLGNIQHLKNKYGKGYTLIVKTKLCETQDDSKIIRLQEFVSLNIPTAVLTDRQDETLYYQINQTEINSDSKRTMSIGHIFRLFEQTKEYLDLETYSLSQTTLEQVFLFFAKNQSTNPTNQVPVVMRNQPAQNSQANQQNIANSGAYNQNEVHFNKNTNTINF